MKPPPHLSTDLSLSGEESPALRSGYDAPETTFVDGDGEDTGVERWCSGPRVGQPVTAEERRAIADAQIERWRVWGHRRHDLERAPMTDDRTIDLRGRPMNPDDLKVGARGLKPDEFYVPEAVWKEASKMTPAEQDAAFREAALTPQTQLEAFIAWLRYYRAARHHADEVARQTALSNMQTIVDVAQNPIGHGGGGDGSFTAETWVEARDLVARLSAAETALADSGTHFLVSRGHKP